MSTYDDNDGFPSSPRSPRSSYQGGRGRDFSPSYHSGGGGGTRRGYSPRNSSDNFQRESMHLEPYPGGRGPDSRSRSRGPSNTAVMRRSPSISRSRSPYSDEDDWYSDEESEDDRRRGGGNKRDHHGGKNGGSPMERAKNIVDENFTTSHAGIGAGLLGAVVGGIVGKEASDAAARRRHKQRGYKRSDSDNEIPRVVTTLLGAVAGGLGANALTNRVEHSRHRERLRQYEWEQQYGDEEDLPHYDSGKRGDMDHRGGRGLPAPGGRDGEGGGGGERDGYVYDDFDGYPRRGISMGDEGGRPGSRRGDDGYRYRQ